MKALGRSMAVVRGTPLSAGAAGHGRQEPVGKMAADVAAELG